MSCKYSGHGSLNPSGWTRLETDSNAMQWGGSWMLKCSEDPSLQILWMYLNQNWDQRRTPAFSRGPTGLEQLCPCPIYVATEHHGLTILEAKYLKSWAGSEWTWTFQHVWKHRRACFLFPPLAARRPGWWPAGRWMASGFRGLQGLLTTVLHGGLSWSWRGPQTSTTRPVFYLRASLLLMRC